MLKRTPYILLIVMLFAVSKLFAQEIEMNGVVFDQQTGQRVNRVNINNLRTGIKLFNNTKAEFKINVKPGDKLVAVAEGYYIDTLIYVNQTALVFYLKRVAIPLKEVLVKDSVLSAMKRYEELRKQFSSLNRLTNRDLLSFGQSGVGLSIDALWNSFSREGRNAKKLQEVMERDYMNNFIDEKFNKSLVSKYTGLKGDQLELFMINYRPSYYFVYGASDYDLISYVKIAYIRFKKKPYPDEVSNLKPIETP